MNTSTIVITAELLALLSEIDEFKGAWRALGILDHVRDHGRVTTRDMVRLHNASPNTLKSTFGKLVEKKLLTRHGAGRSIWYGLPG